MRVPDEKDRFMHHRNAPPSVEGGRRLVERCENRPIAHAAAEMGISRACASNVGLFCHRCQRAE